MNPNCVLPGCKERTLCLSHTAIVNISFSCSPALPLMSELLSSPLLWAPVRVLCDLLPLV